MTQPVSMMMLKNANTIGDSVSTRFGMREFRFDAATKRAYLNGKVYFLRGSNITLHRMPRCCCRATSKYGSSSRL